MASRYLEEFEKLNTTTESIYELGDFNVVIILNDGSNLTDWDDVKDKEDIIYVSENLSNYTNLSRKYQGLKSLKAIVARDVKNSVTDMTEMFRGCESLNELHLSDWDVSNVCDMSWMFRGCESLTDISALREWDVSGAKWMMGMFYSCSALKDLLPLSGWDVSNVNYMAFNLFFGEEGMFSGCSSLEDLSPLADWDVSSVKDMMNLFENCSSIADLSPLAQWDVSSVATMKNMFNGCSSLEDLSVLADWDVSSVKDMKGMFKDCNRLDRLSGLDDWNVSSVRDMEAMFYGCSSLTDLDALSAWNVSELMNMKWMFRNCHNLADISGLANWDLSNVENMKYLFECCCSLVEVYALKDWDISSARDMRYMFQDTNIKDVSPLANWNVTSSNNVLGIFDVPDSSEIDISLLDGWEIDLVTRRVMFRSVKMGRHIPQKSIDKAVSMYFNEYGEDDVLKIYNQDKKHHFNYILAKLNVAYSKKSIKRIKGEIEKTFQERLNPIDISSAPKGLLLICDILMRDYGDEGLDRCMEMFEKKYPMKSEDSDMVRAILTRKFLKSDLN
jgi:surface protein